jgi:hypothetical protein
LFDIAIGYDNMFRGDRYKWSSRITVINVANKEAVYNFLSTFSGTHYVTPRAITGESASTFKGEPLPQGKRTGRYMDESPFLRA